MAPAIEKVDWDEFTRRFRWEQGEHLAAIAPTGGGKTTVFSELMPYRRYSIMLGTKPDDDLYRQIIRRHGFRRVETLAEARSYDERILVWPQQQKLIKDTVLRQQAAFKETLNAIAVQKAWTVWVDEAKYISEYLHLRGELTYMLEQMRSVKSTIICGAQRPVSLPTATLANSTHVFLAKSNRREDAKILADVGGIDSRLVAETAKELERFEFIYIHTRGTESRAIRTRVAR